MFLVAIAVTSLIEFLNDFSMENQFILAECIMRDFRSGLTFRQDVSSMFFSSSRASATGPKDPLFSP